MPLTAEQLAARGEIGASDCPVIVAGTDEQRNDLWRVKCGLAAPPDLSNVWEVQRGAHMEPFIRSWQERKLGYAFSDVGAVHQHPKFDWLTCTLDGFDAQRDAVVEIKTSVSFDFARRWYAAQIEVQREIVGCRNALLLISVLGHEPVEVDIDFDQAFRDEAFERICAFKICVETITPPHPVAPVYPPEKWRNIDLTVEDPNWKEEMIEQLQVWSETKSFADLHAQAAASAKSLVPNDVGRLRFHNISINRNKRGALSIQQKKDAA
jgi:predicted phage-related endonuclease